MTPTTKLNSLSDARLLSRLSCLMKQSRRVEAELVAHIGEVERRRLYAREAFPSMFAYCVKNLNLSEHEAYLRIAVARACRMHPVLVEMLADGRLHLSGIDKLAPHLTKQNRASVLARAAYKSKREIEELVAELAPKPDVRTTVRKLPAPRASSQPIASRQPTEPARKEPRVETPVRVTAPRPPEPEPLAPSRYKVTFTVSGAFRDKLERLTALMNEADIAAVLEQAVTEKIERIEAKRVAKTRAPRKSVSESDTKPVSRYIPAPVRRVVHERDEGRCTFVDANGRRCSERNRVEFHHDTAFARGGSHAPANVRLLCRAHNAYYAEQDFGKNVIDRFRGVRETAPVYGLTRPTDRFRTIDFELGPDPVEHPIVCGVIPTTGNLLRARFTRSSS